MSKLPKKHESHKNSGIAKSQLREMFGTVWNIIEPKDMDSGIEYGLDFLIEIVTEDGEVTGQQFGIQSKVLDKQSRFTRNGIGTSIKISTLNYLSGLPYPVLFHFIDKLTGKGYVIWLSDWLKDNPSHIWQKNKKKRVNIPLSNLFENSMIQQIIAYIDQYYFIQNLRKQADHINWYSKDHFVDVEIDYTSKYETTVTVHPRHEGAISHITPLDDEAVKAFRESIELGIPKKIGGKLGISNVPASLFDNATNIEVVDAILYPNLENEPSHPFRFSFIDGNKKVLGSINYLEVKPIQLGTKIRIWSTTIFEDLISFTLTYNIELQEIFWTIRSHPENAKENSPRLFLEYFRFIDMSNKSKYMDIESLQENTISRLDVPQSNFDFDQNPYMKSLENLVFIMDIFGIELIVQPHFSFDEMSYINDIAIVIRTGTIHRLLVSPLNEESIVATIDAEIDKARQTFDTIKSDNAPIVIRNSEVTFANFWGLQVDLGASELVLCNINLLNEDEVYNKLQANSDEVVRLVFSFDKDKSYTQFPKWLKSGDQFEADKDNTSRKPGSAEGSIQTSDDFDKSLDDFNGYME